MLDALTFPRRAMAPVLLLGALGSLVTLAVRPMPSHQTATHQTATHETSTIYETTAQEPASTNAARPASVVRPLSCEKLADVPGKAITTAMVTFPPGAFTPAHRHPGSVTAYVLEGVVRSQLAGGPALTYRAGGTWFEPPGALHLFAENASATQRARILAIFVADETCEQLVIPAR